MDNKSENNFFSIKSYLDYVFRLIIGGLLGMAFMVVFWMMCNDPEYQVKGLEIVINHTSMVYILLICFLRVLFFTWKRRSFVIKGKTAFKKVIILPISYTFSVFAVITIVLFSIFDWMN